MSPVVRCLQNRVFWQLPMVGRTHGQAPQSCLPWRRDRMLESTDHSMDCMEQQKVNIELEEQSNSGESLEDNYTELIESEKAAIRR